MKLNKKLIALVAAVTVSGATFVGCSSADESTQTEGTVVETTTEDSEVVEEEATEGEVAEEETTEEGEVTEEESTEDVTPEPEVEATPEPEVAPEPEVEATPEPEVAPEPEVEATPEPEVAPEPEVEATPEPEVAPEPEVEETPEPEANTGMSAQQVFEGMLEGFVQGENFPPLAEAPAEMISETYGLDLGLVKSFVVYAPMMMTHSTEVAVFELNDAADAETVKAGIAKRVEGLMKQWESYLPDQYENVQNHKVAVSGNYVVFVVSEHADAIITNFNNLAK